MRCSVTCSRILQMKVKHPSTLAEDIYTLLDRQVHHDPDPRLLAEYGERASATLARSFELRDKPRDTSKIWFSDLGEECERKLWYTFNQTESSETLMGHTLFKFSYGDILEDKVLYLAKEAGHRVEGEQDRVEQIHPAEGVTLSGRIDAVIDGVLIDVKSTSSYGYSKYTKEGLNPGNDTFGYLWQLSGYFHKYGKLENTPGFVWIDKQNGHIAYTEIEPYTEEQVDDEVARIASVIKQDKVKGFRQRVKAEGKSGNEVLSIKCSYCPFKQHCWSKAEGGPGLRTFIYSNGPKYFTKVVNLPRVYEVTGEE